jgi:hypothetical protein
VQVGALRRDGTKSPAGVPAPGHDQAEADSVGGAVARPYQKIASP